MISASLISSLGLFAALIWVAAMALGLGLAQVIKAGSIAVLALLSSSLAVTQWGQIDGGNLWPYGVRFGPPLLVFAIGNLAGRWRVAVMQLAWLWAVLDLTYMVQFGASPDLSGFLQGYMPVYPILPLMACACTASLGAVFWRRRRG